MSNINKEVEQTFKKLIKQIPKDQRKKEFYLVCFGLAAYDKESYKGFKVFNVESERDEVTIISKRDFDNFMNLDLEDAIIVEDEK